MPDRDFCTECAELIPIRRADLGYTTCMPCGELIARARKHTIVPMHKSNYMVVTDREMLKQLTRPGRGLGG